MLAPYPIEKPFHGGQKRASAIFQEYKSIFKNSKYIGIYHRSFYQDQGAEDILLGDLGLIHDIDSNPQTADLKTGISIDRDVHVRSQIAKILMEFRPNIIHIEQPYLYMGLRVLLRELNIKPELIIYGSQNIEYKMKDDIRKNIITDGAITKDIICETRELEKKFSQEADLVIAVSKQDMNEHIKMGAKKCIVCSNGVYKIAANNKSIKYWEDYKKNNNIKKVALFVGSGHPPNWSGYLDLIGDDSSFLADDEAIFIAGGVSEYFKAKYSKNSNHWSKAHLLGTISDELLTGLISVSDIILLPINSGGGSNLKTAEAIISGKNIIATDYSFRGFYKYVKLPNVNIANNSNDFKKQILSIFARGSYTPLNTKDISTSNKVSWDYALRKINRTVPGLLIKLYIFKFLKKITRRIKRFIYKQ